MVIFKFGEKVWIPLRYIYVVSFEFLEREKNYDICIF